ncbi:DUF1993 family protein [Amaricoccus solimangrovi]|uniref:DUF1993 domain-containing protein n=1 Tax=Amaricoccus solimangrovi TaxID=2589815 RepID=A0A501WTQ1_9RHOB|nr:DUF1993 family protein [Amaricoccus solimangrovi]TPE51494.1 DUF1993 domain-containing protein [Amaricoccus solimangrovi]
MDQKPPPFYRASVPVFIAVLDRLEATLVRAEEHLGPLYPEALTLRPHPEMMPAARQVATTAQFALRIAFPLVGRRAPELRDPLDGPGLLARLEGARGLLRGLDPEDFAHSGRRIIRAQAGIAHLELPAEQFLNGFGLPNLYFHHAMAYLALRNAGVTLGKADFDGLHEYPPGFSFG